MEDGDRPGDRAFWLQWIGASMAGATFGTLMGAVIGVGFGLWFGFFVVGTLYLPLVFLGDLPDDFAGFPVVVIAAFLGMGTFGLVVGIAQGLVLRGAFEWHGSWESSTMMGYGTGLVTLYLLLDAMDPLAAGALTGSVKGAGAGAVAGGVMGVTQWLALRRRVSWARWWALPTVAGGGLATFIGLLTSSAMGPFVALPVGLLAFFATTGGAMVWVLRLPVSPVVKATTRREVAPAIAKKGLVGEILREFDKSQRVRHDTDHRSRILQDRKAGRR